MSAFHSKGIAACVASPGSSSLRGMAAGQAWMSERLVAALEFEDVAAVDDADVGHLVHHRAVVVVDRLLDHHVRLMCSRACPRAPK